MPPEIKSYLQSIGISFRIISHPPLFTCKDAEEYNQELKGIHLKNLLLKTINNPKVFYLVILPADKKLNLKYLNEKFNNKFSFANDIELNEFLGLTKGAVSPFGLINDENKIVELLIDKEILEENYVSFHPNINTETIELTLDDFKRFLDSIKVVYEVI